MRNGGKKTAVRIRVKTNQRIAKILILTPQCAVWLHGVMMHTTELDSKVGRTPQSLTPRCASHCEVRLCGRKHTAELEVWCTLQSFLRNLVQLTPRWDAHRRAQLQGGMHTVESNSAVCITPRSQMHQISLFFVLSCSTTFYKKMSVVKKVP